MIYLLLNSYPGAELACSISAYVHNHLKQYAAEVDSFIFQELNPPATKDVKEANAAVYGSLKAKFPWLAKEFPEADMEKVWEKLRSGSNIKEQTSYAVNLGIRGTPVTFVDGRRMDGIDWAKFERFLSY